MVSHVGTSGRRGVYHVQIFSIFLDDFDSREVSWFDEQEHDRFLDTLLTHLHRTNLLLDHS